MSLDQFGVSGGTKKEKTKHSKPKLSDIKKSSVKTSKNDGTISEPGKRYKFFLNCIKSCGFKKVLRKRSLTENDYICPKCGRKLKLSKKE